MTTKSIAHPMPIPTPPRGLTLTPMPPAAVRRPGRHRLVRRTRWQRTVDAVTRWMVSS
ncbi:MAG: hypothetical protein J0I34_07480 [Pseudonocardia sp.]|uniref:hypothetical protein n=1 Tax=Actinomycetes TaxID=1760 RepID=UPI001AD322F8|nr:MULTISPECIES: hypothetical protein [Actinomycetes]MBN9108609.1 hypothetical protein [Pseudonocardia sp.]